MHLKSLTLRGFKSFASSTTLRFEPGVTCVVGPNGSGKSNVVDALAWVMGEQGAKSLRGGKMEDVIFAGTSGRPPLGRAEVVLTIDNADRALPIDYTEVTLARTMFRNGGSEYAINGQPCRLLDVQELLADSGIGREMHVIVGQGQLDAILSATPEDRRGFVEEAAGVLKHRKRKEKALRKLDAMQGNLTRLQDLTAELRRQLGPLSRQAEVARRAQVIQADARDARLRLLADDIGRLQGELAREVADETALRERQAALAAAASAARQEEASLEEQARSAAPALATAQETWYALSSLRERLRGTASLAAERVRQGAAAEPPSPGRDPVALEAEAARVRQQEEELAAGVTRDRAALAEAVAARQGAEEAAAAEGRRLAGLARAAADRREGLARLIGQVDALRARAGAAEDELARLAAARGEAAARAAAAQHEFTALESTVAGLSVGEEDLDAEHAAVERALAEVEAALVRALEEERAGEQRRAALAARVEALALGLTRRDGAGVLLAADERVSGLLGTVAALLQVKPGAEAAVAAALGAAAEAVAVDSVDAAVEALHRLKDDDLGQARLLVAAPGDQPPRDWPALPGGLRYALDLLSAPSALQAALAQVLHKVAVVDDLATARALVEAVPDVVAATSDGELLGAHLAAGGSTDSPSLLEVQAAADEAAEALTAAGHALERSRFALSELRRSRDDAAARVQATLGRLHESDAELSAVAERLGQLGSAARAAAAEAERLDRAISDAEAARDGALAGLAELEARLAAAEQSGDDGSGDDGTGEPDAAEHDRLEQVARAARIAETDARLALRTGEERVRSLGGRAESLERAARQERAARAEAERRRERRAREAQVAAAVGRGAALTLARLEQSLAAAGRHRDEGQRRVAESGSGLHRLRARIREVSAELDEITGSVHRDELARAEQRVRIEALVSKATEEHGLPVEELLAGYGPDVLVPPSPSAPDEAAQVEGPDEGPAAGAAERRVEEPQPRPYVRAEQERRLRAAERQLALLGRVNALALEEFAALEERQRFLAEQLRDLDKTRRDLLDIVREVDERVEQVFAAAYADVAREFEAAFARLFPGGAGRLVLTDPSDLLTTGIEVEARPPGKQVKRLSLLSGGERALVAVAFLVALFKARPSPFYILDEVEAALDDTNLGRLLELYDELRTTSQLIVITHQKRTMEVADALYGASMRGDGVTTVISQRLREAAPA